MQVQVLCIIYLKSYWWLILCINNFLFFLCDIILSGDSIFSNLCPHISYKIYLTNHEMSHSLNNLPQGAYEKPVNIVQLNIFQLASSLSNSSWCGKFNRKLHPTGINSWYSQSICLCLHTCNYLLVWGTMVMNLPHRLHIWGIFTWGSLYLAAERWRSWHSTYKMSAKYDLIFLWDYTFHKANLSNEHKI